MHKTKLESCRTAKAELSVNYILNAHKCITAYSSKPAKYYTVSVCVVLTPGMLEHYSMYGQAILMTNSQLENYPPLGVLP